MLKSYAKIAWRNILRHKLYTSINLLGLTAGICACIVIYTITSYELSFDTFHPGKERIYRVMGDLTESTGDKLHFARIPLAVSQDGRPVLAGLETIAGIIPWNVKITIPHTGEKPADHFESTVEGTHYLTTAITEPQYFDIFQYEWLAGDASTAMQAPYMVVLTESKARQYFGSVPLDKMIGKQVIYEDSLIVSVSGIIKDWNKNTDLSFTDFISFNTMRTSFLKNKISSGSWNQRAMNTWVFTKLANNTTPAQVNAGIAELVKTHGDQNTKLNFWLEPLSDIHFNADVIENPIRTAHKPTLYGLMAVALFILTLAIINFINLSTAQSMQRAKEVGVRKVLGSGRAGLVFQFLTETLLLTLFAVILAVFLVNPLLIFFRSYIPPGVSFRFFDFTTIVFIIITTIVTALLAGFYPARILSSYLPALILKGTGMQGTSRKWLLRKTLIVFQFTVSLVFIMGSIVITWQLKYVREKDHGFKADAIITVETPRGDSMAKISRLAQKIKQVSGVNNIALQWLPPMTDNPRGMKLKLKSTDEKDFWVTQVAGNENFLPLYQLKLLAGRNLVRSDSVNEFVINESLSRYIGYKTPDASLGKILYWNDQPYPIVGVVADFHTKSLHDLITPLCIINRPDREGSIAIKLASAGKQRGMISTTLQQVSEVWKQVYPASTFSYHFYDESLELLYEKDQQTADLVNTSMAITIFISCIGLFGLALFIAEKRAKEISIRKILGATITSIVTMLSKDFVILVIIALLIASPIAWYLMNQWLQGFAYRIQISWWIFLLAGIIMIIIALLTVSVQAFKTAITSPAKSLRVE